jgi:hypothetical protein
MDGHARLVWKLARNHSWGTPIDDEALIRLATTTEDHDEMRKHLEVVLDLPFVVHGPDGVYIPNGQDAHIAAANWLRENTQRADFVIANTLSRLPPTWPDTTPDSK